MRRCSIELDHVDGVNVRRTNSIILRYCGDSDLCYNKFYSFMNAEMNEKIEVYRIFFRLYSTLMPVNLHAHRYFDIE